MPAAKLAPSAAVLAMADELGDLDAKLKPFKTALDRREELKKALRVHAANFPDSETIMVTGKRWFVVLGTKPADASVLAFTRAGSRRIEIGKKAKRS